MGRRIIESGIDDNALCGGESIRLSTLFRKWSLSCPVSGLLQTLTRQQSIMLRTRQSLSLPPISCGFFVCRKGQFNQILLLIIHPVPLFTEGKYRARGTVTPRGEAKCDFFSQKKIFVLFLPFCADWLSLFDRLSVGSLAVSPWLRQQRPYGGRKSNWIEEL